MKTRNACAVPDIGTVWVQQQMTPERERMRACSTLAVMPSVAHILAVTTVLSDHSCLEQICMYAPDGAASS